MAEKFDSSHPLGENPRRKKTPEVTQKKSKGNGVLCTLAGLAIGAGAVYGYNEYTEDNKDTQPDTQAPIVQKVEAPMACPQFNPTKINGTATEWRAQADVKQGLGTASFRFSSQLNDVIANEACAFMVETGDTPKADCLFYTCDKLLKSFKYDAEHPHIDQDADQTRLFSCFPVTMAVLTQDLYGAASLRKHEVPRGRIVHATILRTKALAANLNGYSKDESADLLRTFGGLMTEPELARTAAEAAQKNPAHAAQVLAGIYASTADILDNNPHMSAHAATCQAVRVAFDDDTKDPLAFYSYIQTMHDMNGKTRANAIQTLKTNAQNAKAEGASWIERNSAWILVGAGIAALGGFALMKKSANK